MYVPIFRCDDMQVEGLPTHICEYRCTVEPMIVDIYMYIYAYICVCMYLYLNMMIYTVKGSRPTSASTGPKSNT